MGWAIQKATELGVSRLVPLITNRTVVRPRSGRTDHQTGRWQSIALEAAQQSMRWDVPIVEAPKAFDSWLAETDRNAYRMLLWEQPKGTRLRDRLRGRCKPDAVVVTIGPEGGFDAEEVERAERQGFDVVSLGDRILRSESAVLAALAIVQYEWGDVG